MSMQPVITEERARRAFAALLARARKARTSLPDFFEFVMREETTRERLKVLPHQRVLLDFIQAHSPCVVMLPVGHTKTVTSVAMGLFFAGQDCTSRGAFVSATQDQAGKPLKAMRDYIETSEELRLVFPELMKSPRKADTWTQTAITVDRPPGIRDPTVIAVGLDGAIPGARLSWIVPDDILNRENTNTRAGRDTVEDWLDSSVLSRLDPGNSRFCLMNTPWHSDDVLHRKRKLGWPTIRMSVSGDIEIINADDWDHPLLRARDSRSNLCRLIAHDPDPHNEIALWPERYTPEEIEKRRRSMLPYRFAQLYQCIARDDDTARCKIEYVNTCKLEARKRGIHNLVHEYNGQNPTFTGVDLAVSPGEENDEVAFFTFEALPSGHKRILDIDIGQWPGPEIIDKLFDKVKRFKSYVMVENNGAQQFIVQFALKRNVAIPVKGFMTGRAKAHPEHGVEGLFVEMQNGVWLIPNDTAGRCPAVVERFVQDCLEYVPTRHTADVLMGAYMARERARDFGVLNDFASNASMNVGASIMSR